MSDTPLGDGYWKASDGKYYPPQQHPGYRPPPPAGPGQEPPQPYGQQPPGPGQTAPPPAWGQPRPAPAFAPVEPTPTRPVAAWVRGVLAAGVVLTVIAAFLPWVSAESPGFSETVSGTEGDGVLTIVLAVLAVVFGFRALLQKQASLLAIGTVVCGVLILLIAIIDMADVNNFDNDFAGLDSSIGFGLYLTALGGVIVAVAGGFAIRGSRTRP